MFGGASRDGARDLYMTDLPVEQIDLETGDGDGNCFFNYISFSLLFEVICLLNSGARFAISLQT